MWITTSTIDLNALRALSIEEQAVIANGLNEKKNQLRSDPSNGGNSLEGFRPFDSFNEVDPGESVRVVKRGWNVQSVAQEFTDYTNTLHSSIVTILEEQV
jgi:hypothetical protein